MCDQPVCRNNSVNIDNFTSMFFLSLLLGVFWYSCFVEWMEQRKIVTYIKMCIYTARQAGGHIDVQSVALSHMQLGDTLGDTDGISCCSGFCIFCLGRNGTIINHIHQPLSLCDLHIELRESQPNHVFTYMTIIKAIFIHIVMFTAIIIYKLKIKSA